MARGVVGSKENGCAPRPSATAGAQNQNDLLLAADRWALPQTSSRNPTPVGGWSSPEIPDFMERGYQTQIAAIWASAMLIGDPASCSQPPHNAFTIWDSSVILVFRPAARPEVAGKPLKTHRRTLRVICGEG